MIWVSVIRIVLRLQIIVKCLADFIDHAVKRFNRRNKTYIDRRLAKEFSALCHILIDQGYGSTKLLCHPVYKYPVGTVQLLLHLGFCGVGQRLITVDESLVLARTHDSDANAHVLHHLGVLAVDSEYANGAHDGRLNRMDAATSHTQAVCR